jgi:xylitol oxidase
MDKRQFLKRSGALIARSALARAATGGTKSVARTNWAGNYMYRAERVDEPRSLAEIQAIVKERRRLKALGSHHSFNSIADTTGDQISLKYFDEMTINPRSGTVTVGGGITYGQLGPYLDHHGYALHNLASLPHISVAGACATATHGSGNKNSNLAAAVSALEFVTAAGEVVSLSRERDGERFAGAVVHLGALGVMTRLTLKVEPTYQVRQVVYENLSMDRLQRHLEEIFESGYCVSLFTDWRNHRITQVWIKSRVRPGAPDATPPDFFGAKRATRKLHPLADHSAESCTEQMGIPGPWYDRLPHFRLNFVPSSGAELQSEYFVPRARGYEAIMAVESLRDRVTPHLLITELRTIDADDLWMSTCYGRPSMSIHFTWKPQWPAVRELLPIIEEKLAPFKARPHWGKLFTMPPARLVSLYEKLPGYKAFVEQHDPEGKFRNDFLAANLFGGRR